LADGRQVTAINFDNAATTPAFTPVMEEVNKQLLYYGSIGRGKGQKSAHSTEIYGNGRKAVLDFVNADSDTYTVFYVNSTTDGLNKLSSALIQDKDDIVLTTRMEHHANDLPWRHRGKTIYADVDSDGRLRMDDVERLLKNNNVKFVTVTAAANATGYVNDVHTIARLAHENGAQIIVDGAQIVSHKSFCMKGKNANESIDYFVFSAHKMYAPYGGGAVIGLKAELDERMPKFYGGGMVDVVSDYEDKYFDSPERYEAGSPNYTGVVAMLKSIEILKQVGFEYIIEHEQELMRKTIDGLKRIPSVTLYGDNENIMDKVGIVVFNIEGIPHIEVAQQLADGYGIAVRQGAFCSHPYIFRLLGIPNSEVVEKMYSPDFEMPGIVRVSFGIYNDESEVDALLEAVEQIAKRTSGVA
jgi:selenocysteine lyase/cysteine desulfurase